jgi:CBS-domain-containing membrane protein
VVILGALSDASTSPLGRRRPLILAGLIAAVLGLGLFPFTDAIGLWLGDSSTSHPIAIGLGIAVITVSTQTTILPLSCATALESAFDVLGLK